MSDLHQALFFIAAIIVVALLAYLVLWVYHIRRARVGEICENCAYKWLKGDAPMCGYGMGFEPLPHFKSCGFFVRRKPDGKE